MTHRTGRPRLRCATSVRRAALLACVLLAAAARAQVATDGSTGAPATTLTGPAYLVPQALGKLSGANLFHSFRSFSIGLGESATFTTSTPGIANVISRVTGGSVSEINGLLRLSAADGTPGFFFINPAGVTFGNGASIDVPGAFHVSTADHLAFADGRFEADPVRGSSFSSAVPEAFGFLGTQRGAVTLQPGAALLGRRGQAIGIVAGDITLEGGVVGSGAGSIRLAAVGRQAAEVAVGGALPTLGGALWLGNEAAVLSAAVGALPGAPIALSAGRVDVGSGASIFSGTDTAAPGGSIEVQARDLLRLGAGGNITAVTTASGDSGAIQLRTARLEMDSGGYVFGWGQDGSSGHIGALRIDVTGAALLGGGASVSTEADGSGSGSGIALKAGSVGIVDDAYLRTDTVGTGAPGDITLDVAGALTLGRFGHLYSLSEGDADAGSLGLRAGSLRLDEGAYLVTESARGARAGSGAIQLDIAGDVVLSTGALLRSRTQGSGDAGGVRIAANHLMLQGASVFSNAAGTAGASGQVDITLAGNLVLLDASSVSTSTLSSGPAGSVRIRAGDVTVADDSDISSRALEGNGAAGTIDLTATGRLWLRNGATLSSTTSTAGDGGSIRLSAASALLEGGSGITTLAGSGSSGRSGNIALETAGELALTGGSSIVVLTGGSGDAGQVQIRAGSIDLRSASNIGAAAAPGSTGDAGRIDLVAKGEVSLREAASITSGTLGAGDGGTVTVSAAKLLLDSGAFITSSSVGAGSGNAGRIVLTLVGDLQLRDSGGGAPGERAVVSTSTQGRGNGGEILVQANSVLVDGPGVGIIAVAGPESQGDAGSITVNATRDLVLRGGQLASNSFGAGAAGTVQVRAARVLVDGPSAAISASAGPGSGGQTGSVTVQADDRVELSHGARFSITNDATVVDALPRLPTTLRVSAPVVLLRGAGLLTNASGNVAASSIEVVAPVSLTLDNGVVSTIANGGDGGAVQVSTGGLLSLRDAAVTTSVLGQQGDGGDIDITARTVLLDTGFIQANTAAADASGGLVRIATGALVASGNALLLAGDTPFVPVPGIFGFNVIQAAAPTGVSGVVQLDSPVLDVTGSLRALRGEAVDPGGLGRSLCENTGGSALAPSGRGGLPASAGGLLRAESPRSPPTASAAAGSTVPPAPRSAASDLPGCR